MKLLLNEFCEFLTPIMFVLSIIVAYYGPNARIIGNVNNNYWQYGKIENISSYVSGVLCVTLIDLFVGFLSITLLSVLCKIDVFVICKEIIRKLINIVLTKKSTRSRW